MTQDLMNGNEICYGLGSAVRLRWPGECEGGLQRYRVRSLHVYLCEAHEKHLDEEDRKILHKVEEE